MSIIFYEHVHVHVDVLVNANEHWWTLMYITVNVCVCECANECVNWVVMVLVQNDNSLPGPQLVQQSLYRIKQPDEKPRFLDLLSCVHPSGSVFHTLLLVCSHISVARTIDTSPYIDAFATGSYIRCRVYFTFLLELQSMCIYVQHAVIWHDQPKIDPGSFLLPEQRPQCAGASLAELSMFFFSPVGLRL